MKIRSVRIDSFGIFKDKKYSDISPGLTVIYGKNETGKTTLMEFIRSTLFPGKQRKVYPAYNKTDAGEIRIDLDDAVDITIVRNGKASVFEKNGKQLLTDITHIDAVTYRSIFAMNPDDLRDLEIVSSGDIKNRFLTIPGGENLPSVIEDIDKESSLLMTTTRMTETTKIGSKISEIERINVNIANSTVIGNRYSELYIELSELELQIGDLKKKELVNAELRAVTNLRNSQVNNITTLEGLRETRKLLVDSEIIHEGDKEQYDRLKADIETKIEVCKRVNSRLSVASVPLNDYDKDAILQNKDRIEALKDKIGLYSELSNQKNDFEMEIERDTRTLNRNMSELGITKDMFDGKVAIRAPSTNYSVKRFPLSFTLMLAGIVLLAAGIFTSLYILMIGLIPLLSGVILLFRNNNTTKKVHKDAGLVDLDIVNLRNYNESIDTKMKDLEKINSKLSEMSKELNYVADAVNIPRSSFRTDIILLSDLVSKSIMVKKIADERSDVNHELKESEMNFRLFISKFGTEERFLILYKQSVKRSDLDRKIYVLEDSIKSSGYDMNAKGFEEIPVLEDVTERLDMMNKHYGELKSEMKAIMDDEYIEGLMNARASSRSELRELVKRWGILSLASAITDIACKEIYDTVQPDVVKTANTYIDLMTCGRYSLDSDPRNTGISVISNDTMKTENQWSSGLGDQIRLSLKMAVAKELSSEERLPIMLDDVLLMFDSDRKRGACKALLKMSEDMQILFFTCDRETKDIMLDEGCTSVLEL